MGSSWSLKEVSGVIGGRSLIPVEIIFVHPNKEPKEETPKPTAIHYTYDEAERLVENLCKRDTIAESERNHFLHQFYYVKNLGKSIQTNLGGSKWPHLEQSN